MSMEYRSLKAQVGHYFKRPHDDIPTSEVISEAAWVGSELPAMDELAHVFSVDEIAEIQSAITFAKSIKKDTKDLGKADFPLPTIQFLIDIWRRNLSDGIGFQIIRGLPVDTWTQNDAELFFWGFGLHLGIPGVQNPEGHLLGHVTDTGSDNADEMVRLYKTSANIQYHCDAADVVGLLCLNAAKSGGKSRIVSSVTVFNRLLRQNPKLAGRLFEPLMLDRRGEIGRDGLQFSHIVPSRYAEGKLKTFYHTDYFRSVSRHPNAPKFTKIEQALFDTYEEIASNPEVYFDMDLIPGDIQLLSNHTNLHARTDYVDDEDPKKKRHLLRLWLSLD